MDGLDFLQKPQHSMRQSYRNLLVPALLIVFTTVARADVISLTKSASDALENLGTKFVIGCALLALGMIGAAIALRKK